MLVHGTLKDVLPDEQISMMVVALRFVVYKRVAHNVNRNINCWIFLKLRSFVNFEAVCIFQSLHISRRHYREDIAVKKCSRVYSSREQRTWHEN